MAREITEHNGDLAVVSVGRKGRDAMRRSRVPIEAHFAGFGDKPTFADVLPLARLITEDFLSRRVRPDRPRLQPVHLDRCRSSPILDSSCRSSRREDTEGIPGNQFIFEPSPAAVLEQLLPRYVATRLFHAVLEAKASEESSRMVAMKNATENAGELIDDLTLAYNKVRQSNITREMIEIATGARASYRAVPQEDDTTMASAPPTTPSAGSSRSPARWSTSSSRPAQLPAILNAVEIIREGQEPLTCEVAAAPRQQLGPLASP